MFSAVAKDDYMKRFFMFALFIAVLSLMPAMAYNETETRRVVIDGVTVDATSVNAEMLPLRDIIEHIGGTVSWDNSRRRITIAVGNRTIAAAVNNPHVSVNRSTVEAEIPLQIIDGRAAVTLCFLADILGMGTGYKNNTFFLSATPASEIPVVTYHHILPDELNTHFYDNIWTVSAENFAMQMRYLYENGFYTPTLCELEAFIFHGRLLPQNSVMIHFDDGYYSNYVFAYPILQRYGLRAVLFPITAEAEALGEYQPEFNRRILQWSAASTLRTGMDVWETASHTHNLHGLALDDKSTLLVTASREEIVEDILRSFYFLTNHRAFAYPLGQFNNTVIEALREAGITMAFTVRNGYITRRSNPMLLPRFMIYNSTPLEGFMKIVNRRA